MNILLFLYLSLSARADIGASGSPIGEARARIQETEKRQREVLSHLYSLNQKIKILSKKRARITERVLEQEAMVRDTARALGQLEQKAVWQKRMLNNRLRQLYQGKDKSNLQLLFSARTPIELERNHRFLKRMIDADYQQLRRYIVALRELIEKRDELKKMVSILAQLQRRMTNQEQAIYEQLGEKAKFVAELRKDKDSRLMELKELREQAVDINQDFAFFERKGEMPAPVDGKISREFGIFVDPKDRFRLMHKGIFYSVPTASEVRSVFAGTVAVSAYLPGYGRTIVVDHGDNYYSVYAHLKQLRHREGARVDEGEVLALTGEGSPLFGPGLHFEIRHFADAIDPRPWLKESVIKTANSF